MSVKDLKTSELLNWISGEDESDGEKVEEMVDELMSRFPFDSIGELEKRIDKLEARMLRMQNHLHGQDGTVYTKE